MEINQTFKSYRDLCSYLEVPVNVGRTKTNQIAHWKNLFTYIKEGNSLTITSIAIQPTPENLLRESFIGDYWTKPISMQIYHLLAGLSKENPDRTAINTLILTTNETYSLVGLTNEYFPTLRYSQSKSDKAFHTLVNNRLYSLINDVLDSMQKKMVVSVRKTYEVTEGLNGSVRLATPREHESINAVTVDLLQTTFRGKNNAIPTLYALNFQGKLPAFLTALRKELGNRYIYYIRKVTAITFTAEGVTNLGRYIKQEASIAAAKNTINHKAYELVTKLIDSTYLKNIEGMAVLEQKAIIEAEAAYFKELLELTIKEYVGDKGNYESILNLIRTMVTVPF